ncbi:LPXTG cell wall anchor domain-containing protein [Arthrobacter sp. 2RAF22]|uniref:LPXTG cell wall anchor domain-containing protein n=1 Tax=Arthrobacter sp. 2RAF22 TaxID=3232996 RepID=UPI003F906EFC
MSFSSPGFFRRAVAVLLGVLVACGFVLGIGGPARADTMPRPVKVVTAAGTACSQQADASSCDADGDGIPDAVEVVVCGSATCATGREDTDKDGIPDWIEVKACGTTTCADPKEDTDGDGIPDYAEQLVCGSATCANGHEDTDGKGVPDWIDYVICGNAGCATGQEDYNHNGISDVAELKACVKDQGFLASTGFQAGMWVLAGVLALGAGAFLYFQNKKKKRTTDEDGDGSVEGLDGDGPGDDGADGFEEPEDGWHSPLEDHGSSSYGATDPTGTEPDAGSVEGGRA